MSQVLTLRSASTSTISTNPALTTTSATTKGSELIIAEMDDNFVFLQNTKENYLNVPSFSGFQHYLTTDNLGNRSWQPIAKEYNYSGSTLTNSDLGKLLGFDRNDGFAKIYQLTPYAGSAAFTVFDVGSTWSGSSFVIYNELTSGSTLINNTTVSPNLGGDNVIDKTNIVSWINLNLPSFRAYYRGDLTATTSGGCIVLEYVSKNSTVNKKSYVSGTTGFVGYNVKVYNGDGIKLDYNPNNTSSSALTYFNFGCASFDAPIMEPIGKLVGYNNSTSKVYLEDNEVDVFITNNNVSPIFNENQNGLYSIIASGNTSPTYSGFSENFKLVVYGDSSGNTRTRETEYDENFKNATAFTLSYIAKPLGLPITSATSGNELRVKRM